MVFPGGKTMETLEEQIESAAPRCRWVKKTYERFDPQEADGAVIVFCFGTFHGGWPDG